MKILIGFLILIPTLIGALLFTVAGLAYNNPALLAATTNPVVAVCCIIAGIIMLLPLLVSLVILLTNLNKSKKNHADTAAKDK